MSNKNAAIIGVFFGDEAKARATNALAKDYQYIIRYNGSSNSGHTLYVGSTKIVRHLIPSADFSQPGQTAFLASNMVVNVEELLNEVKETINIFPNAAKQIIVDPEIFIITKKHIEEDQINKTKIGSTGKGVGPSLINKVARNGTRIIDLIKDNNEIINELKKLGIRFQSSFELYDELVKSNLLFEGAQSILLDLNMGTYPFVTSSSCSLGAIFDSGFADMMPETVYGVSKFYSTRVGLGPYPTEIFGDEAEELRAKGKEYGATTGRARRVGALDLPALDYTCKKGGITNLILTKADILNGMKEVKVCNSYDRKLRYSKDFFDVKPNYIMLPGWEDAKQVEQLRPFISYVEKFVNKPVNYVSCGIEDSDFIKIT